MDAVIEQTFELVSTGRVTLQSTHRQSQSALMHMCGASSVITASFNPLTPNVNYSGRTAPLTSKAAFYIFIQQI